MVAATRESTRGNEKTSAGLNVVHAIHRARFDRHCQVVILCAAGSLLSRGSRLRVARTSWCFYVERVLPDDPLQCQRGDCSNQRAHLKAFAEIEKMYSDDLQISEYRIAARTVLLLVFAVISIIYFLK